MNLYLCRLKLQYFTGHFCCCITFYNKLVRKWRASAAYGRPELAALNTHAGLNCYYIRASGKQLQLKKVQSSGAQVLFFSVSTGRRTSCTERCTKKFLFEEWLDKEHGQVRHSMPKRPVLPLLVSGRITSTSSSIAHNRITRK